MTDQTEYLILLFHSVDDRDVLSLRDLGNLRPEVFEESVVALKSEFDILSLKDMVRCLSGQMRGPDRPLSITFDDGAWSYASRAAPIMGSHGVPSACFLITDCVGDRSVYWRYLYNYCVNAGFEGQLEGLIKEEYDVPATEGGIMRFTRNNFSKRGTESIVRRILSDLIDEGEYREREGRLFLSFDDIRILRKDPLVQFGVHTRSHPVMRGMTDEEIHDEISGSLGFYEREIGDDVPMFSVPFGRLYRDYDGRTVNIARDLSVSVIFSAYGGCNREGQPLYNVRRIPVHEGMVKEGVRSFVASLRYRCAADAFAAEETRLQSAVEGRRLGRRLF